jgi:hypothetical protein
MRIGDWDCHTTRGHRKATIFTSIACGDVCVGITQEIIGVPGQKGGKTKAKVKQANTME